MALSGAELFPVRFAAQPRVSWQQGFGTPRSIWSVQLLSLALPGTQNRSKVGIE